MSVSGVNQTIANLESLRSKFGDSVANALYSGGEVIKGEAIKSIQTVSDGRQVTRYTKSGNSYDHIAAGAGSAPNTDTGELVKRIAVEVANDGVYVGSSLKYAKWLELGTSKMQARPWLLPAKLRSEKKIVKLVKQGVRRVTK